MAVDMFLKIETIDGESSDSKHKNEIEVLSFSWGVSRGQQLGQPRVADFQIVKTLDTASPLLYEAVCRADRIREATFTARKAGGAQQEYLKIKFTDVIITSIAPAGSTGGDALPMDQVSLQFGTAEMVVSRLDEKGQVTAIVAGACGNPGNSHEPPPVVLE